MDASSTILITGSGGMIGNGMKRLLTGRRFTRVLAPTRNVLDLRDQKAVFDYIRSNRPMYVFHFAARSGGLYASSSNPAQFSYDNTLIHANIIEACYRYGVEKLLIPGSANIYPKLAPQPVKESEFMNGKMEQGSLPYLCAQINALVMAQSYAKEFGLSVVLPIITNVYGVGDTFDPKAAHVIPALMQRFHEASLKDVPEVTLWGTGCPLREFIYVDDVADALAMLMEKYESPNFINVGTAQEISIRTLAERVARVVGYEGNINTDETLPDGVPRKVLDCTSLFAMGWKPKVSIQEGLERMYSFHFRQDSQTPVSLGS